MDYKLTEYLPKGVHLFNFSKKEETMNDKDLEVQKDLFVAGGVLGRMDYLISHFKLFGLGIIAAIPYIAGSFLGGAAATGGLALTALMCIGLAYGGYITMFKRLRDIRGTTENQISYQVGTVIAMCIPVVSFFASLGLFFIPGAVTGHGNPFSGHKVKKVAPHNVVELSKASKEPLKKSA